MAESKWQRADNQDLTVRGFGSSGSDSPADADEIDDAQQHRRTGRWRPSNWRLRWKLIVVMLIPAITALALGAIRINDQVASLRGYDQAGQHLSLASTLSTVIDGLQVEREQAALYVASNKTVGSTAFTGTAGHVADAVNQFDQQVANSSGLDSGTAQAMQTAKSQLTDLTGLHAAVTNAQYPEMAVIAQYSTIIQTLIRAVRTATLGVADQRLYAMAVGLDELRSVKEAYSTSNALLMVAAQERSFPGPALNEFQDELSQYQALLAQINNDNSTPGAATPAGAVAALPADQRAVLAQSAVSQAQQHQPVTVDVNQVQQTGDTTVTLLRAVEQTNYNQLTSTTSSLAAAARTAAIRDGLIIFAALLLAFIITLIVARSVLQALRSLRAGALNIARNRLPQNVQRILADPDPIAASSSAVDPVPVFTADEIGEVARSFDVVHSQALRLAAEQAVLRDNVNAIFVNLSRRSQVLVERQLGLIDRLERDEQDPDQLANLFELDHLATRMRRNSESLLVLSGSGLGKRVGRPVPIGELIGAAVSEVEHYARIEAGPAPDVLVVGRVVNDLIHLIAELLDNATSFSDPKTKVSVRIASTKGRELAIQVTDRGVGMTEDDLWENNERLANPPEIDVSVTRRMGLYVVGKLAQRHGVKVRLRANEDLDGGTVALIQVPPDLLQQDGDEPVSMPMLGGPPPGLGSARPQTAAPSGGGPASAAAGIAGAFGVASRAAREERAQQASAQQASGQQASPALEPASSFLLSNDFAPASAFGADAPTHSAAPNGNVFQDFTENPLADGQFGDESSMFTPEEPAEPDEPAEPVSLWEAHTAVDEVDAVIPEPGDAPAAEAFTADFLTGSSGRLEPRELDAPTERLPIYEAVLSQWFRAEPAADKKAGESTELLPIPEALAHPTNYPPLTSPAEPAVPDEPTGQPDYADSVDSAESTDNAQSTAESAESNAESPDNAQPTVPEPGLLDLPAPNYQPNYQSEFASAEDLEPASTETTEPSAPSVGLGRGKPLPSRVPGKAAREIGVWAKRPAENESTSDEDPDNVGLTGAGLTGAGLTGAGRADSGPLDRSPLGNSLVGAGLTGNGQVNPQAAEAERRMAERRAAELDAWRSPADEGWQAAQSVLDSPVGDTTEAGLPKRVPKAHLVPGSIVSAPQPAQEFGGGSSGRSSDPAELGSMGLPPRSADAVRSRMSSFQQGLRRGRHASVEAYSRDASTGSAQRSDEEQE